MKILICSHLLDLSGAPRSLLNIVKSLNKRHRITTIGLVDGPLANEFSRFSSELHIVRYKQSRYFLARGANKIIDIINLLFLVKKNWPDVVLINTMSSMKLQIICQILNIPYMVYVRETEGMVTGILSIFKKNILRFANGIICVSKANREFMLSIGVSDNIISVIPNGLDEDEIKIKSIERVDYNPTWASGNGDYVIVGICGTMSHRKGFDLFVNLIIELIKINSRVRFLVIGDFESTNDSYKNTWLKKISLNNLNDVIHFTGFVLNPYPLLDKIDILAMPSRQESLPRVVLEACALHKAVVAFDVGGTNELLPPNYQHLIPASDFNGFLNSLAMLIENQSERNVIGENLYNFVSVNFSQKHTSDSIVDCLFKIV